MSTSPNSNKRKRSSEPEDTTGHDDAARDVAPGASSEPVTQPPLPDEEPPSESGSEQGELPYESEPEQEAPSSQPPLPTEELPPLPSEPLPHTHQQPQDDGWEPVWDANAQAYYFYNRFTQATQWENPRVPSSSTGTSATNHDRIGEPTKPGAAGGYNPAIHGDYDPSADYAVLARSPSPQPYTSASTTAGPPGTDPSTYAASASFNRFTGRFQANTLNPENFNDENKSKRQMNAFFDVDAAANAHDGRSLRAERQAKKLSKQEVKAFRDKAKAKREERRRAWLRD